MQFGASFVALVAFAAMAIGIPTSSYSDLAETEASYLISYKAMLHWLATTDATLTFIGAPLNPLAPDTAQNAVVTCCSTRTPDNFCGSPCTVYNGAGGTCLLAPNTSCLVATNNVTFCSTKTCDSSCSQLVGCNRLADGFCIAPDTNSIFVPLST